MAGVILMVTTALSTHTTHEAPVVQRNVSTTTPRPDKPRCPAANRAIGFYRQAYAENRARMRVYGLVGRRWWGCRSAARRAVEWREKALQARVVAERWHHTQYAWWEWLPENWRRLGACETGYGREPGNWSHANSGFVSAFGITRHNYAVDARAAGTPQWDDEHPPTPREQYETALAHYRMHGDGWGCPGP